LAYRRKTPCHELVLILSSENIQRDFVLPDLPGGGRMAAGCRHSGFPWPPGALGGRLSAVAGGEPLHGSRPGRGGFGIRQNRSVSVRSSIFVRCEWRCRLQGPIDIPLCHRG
jgi:hypothetical protein